MKYRAGIIGCGWIGTGYSAETSKVKEDSHMKAYQDCPEISGVALCDSKSDYHPYLGFLYTDYMKMIKDMSPDIVSVCTPPETHCQIVCDIAPFVKAIYCEKPIATTLAEADKMIEVCHQNNVILQVNHQRRFMPVKVRFSRGIMDTGTHMFDRLRQLFGEMNINEGRFYFGNQWVEIEYIDTSHLPWQESHIFEIDCVRSQERMILKGVEHLVHCLEEKKQSISSGEEARKTLEAVLIFREMYEGNR